MAYLIVDPCGVYPSHLVRFLARTGQGAVAVFSTPGRWLLWRDKWSKELGAHVLDTFLATQYPSLRGLAGNIADRWPDLEGVIPWDEEHVLLGAALGELLGLGWNPVAVIERCRDKGVMKEWLRQRSRVRVNAAAVVTDAREAFAFQRSLGRWPVVVKPTGGSGSSHVYFPRTDEELLQRCQQVLESGSGAVLLEEYVGGWEIAVNGIVDGKSDLLVTDVWLYDRRTVGGIPNLYYETNKLPSYHPWFARLGGYAAAVVEALGLRRSPIHMELKVDDRGPCLIEVGARLSGGDLPLLASAAHGRSLFELAAVHYLTDAPLQRSDVDFGRYDRYEARVVNGIQTRDVPVIRSVHGVEEVEGLPSFFAFGKLRPTGTRAPVTRDLDTMAYMVHLVHEDLGQVAHDSTRVRQLLRYEG